MKDLTNNMMYTDKYSNQFSPLPNYQLLHVEYPGYKKHGDYRLIHNDDSPSHTDIVKYLYELSKQNPQQMILLFLLRIYRYGLRTNHDVKLNLNNLTLNSTTVTLEQLQHIIFWVTLQEEINYPQPRYQGISLPFFRYFEAILSANHPEIITLEQVISRTNNHKSSVPSLLSSDQIPYPYPELFENLKNAKII